MMVAVEENLPELTCMFRAFSSNRYVSLASGLVCVSVVPARIFRTSTSIYCMLYKAAVV